MEIGSQHIFQHLVVDSEVEADRQFWHWIEGMYRDRLKRSGDWEVTLSVSASIVQDERESNRFRRHFGEVLWKKVAVVLCDEFIFSYEDPDLKRKAMRKREREYKSRNGRTTYP